MLKKHQTYLWHEQMSLDKYYQLLGIEPGASLEEINQAYKDLALIWHPDRLPKDNQRLLEKALAKMQEINQARDELRAMAKQGVKSVQYAAQPSQPPPRPKSASYSPTSYNHRYYKQDFSGADFRGANFKEKDLSGRNFTMADLSHADLSDGFLHRVIFEGANLQRANLFRANLLEANLRNANLQEANLIGADFSGADLRGADLRGAKIRVGDRVMIKLTAAKLAGAIFPDGTLQV